MQLFKKSKCHKSFVSFVYSKTIDNNILNFRLHDARKNYYNILCITEMVNWRRPVHRFYLARATF